MRKKLAPSRGDRKTAKYENENFTVEKFDHELGCTELSLIVNAILFVCFGFSPTAQAVSPPPDGGYGGQNTAEGTNALFNLTTGV